MCIATSDKNQCQSRHLLPKHAKVIMESVYGVLTSPIMKGDDVFFSRFWQLQWLFQNDALREPKWGSLRVGEEWDLW